MIHYFSPFYGEQMVSFISESVFQVYFSVCLIPLLSDILELLYFQLISQDKIIYVNVAQ